MSVRVRVPAVDDPDFIAELDDREGPVLRLTGSADSAATGALASLLDSVHDQLRARHARELVVDLRALDFMATGCMKALIAWLARMHELADADRYRIRLRGSQSIHWQKHTLQALACFDTELVSVEM